MDNVVETRVVPDVVVIVCSVVDSSSVVVIS